MCTRVRFRILASRLPSARATGAQTHTRDARRHLSHVGRPWTRSGDADDNDDALTRLSRVSRRSAREDTRANSKRCPAAIPRLVALVVVALSRNARESAVTTGAMTTTSSSSRASLFTRGIRARTWNVAAINNNPFEYYASSSTTTTTTTGDDDEKSTYDAFTRAVEDQLHQEGSGDAMRDVMTNAMISAVCERARAGRPSACTETTVRRARAHYENRTRSYRVSDFLRDAEIGAKRLCSMPDRVTNTASTATGTTTRPTVINRYDVDMANEEEWFERWLEYVFERRVKGIDGTETTMFERFIPIKRAKYPATSEEEEEASIPLQALYLCAFDAALVRVATRAAGSFEGWQKIRAELVDSLVKCKAERTLDVLEKCLLSPAEDAEDDDETLSVCFLQEVGASFVEGMRAREGLVSRYIILCPEEMDTKRDQNSILLVSKSFAGDDDVVEATGDIMASLGEASSKFSKGDFCAFIVRGVLLCSFHGDTDGLQTKTIVAAANAYVRDNADAVAACVFGMDANTHVAHIDGKKQGVRDFIEFLERETAFKSCWTLAGVDVERDAFTTFSARTHLQAQLNKAVPRAEVLTSPLTDRHPKDHVLIYAPDDTGRETTTTTRPPPSVRRVNAVDFSAAGAPRALDFDPDAFFPNARFPSDHAVVVFTML